MRRRICKELGKVNLGDGTGFHECDDSYDSSISEERARVLEDAGIIRILTPQTNDLPLELELSHDNSVEAEEAISEQIESRCCGNCGWYDYDADPSCCGRTKRKYKPTTRGCAKYWRPRAQA